MNHTIIMGRLTSNPELKQTQSGVACCRFTVAVNRKFKNKQTGEYEADFIQCIAWQQTAEFVARYFSKGKMIAVEGSLRTGSYQDRSHPEVTHYTTDIFVENVDFCGDKSESSTRPQQQNVPQYSQHNALNEGGAINYGDLTDFEEILSDGEVPF